MKQFINNIFKAQRNARKADVLERIFHVQDSHLEYYEAFLASKAGNAKGIGSTLTATLSKIIY